MLNRTMMIFVISLLGAAFHAQAEEGLVEQLTSKLGVSEKQAMGGAGSIFKFVKSQVSEENFGKISDSVPEMGGLLSAAPKSDALGGMLSSALGKDSGGLGAMASLAKPFSKLGMDEGMVMKFMPIVIDYVKKKGGDYIYGLLGKTLIGDKPKEGGLISQLSEKVGVTPEKAVLGAGAIFGYVKNNVSEDDFSKVASAVPEMKKYLGSVAEKEEKEEKSLLGSSGGLGGMVDKIKKPDVLGSDVEKELPGGSKVEEAKDEPGYMQKLKDTFGKLGLDEGLVEKYIPVIMNWVKNQGADYASGVLGKLFTK